MLRYDKKCPLDVFVCVDGVHAYISSHSPSSSSSFGGGGGGAFSFTRSFRSKGHVAWSFSQGAMHSRSNMWFLLQGSRTTRGYSSIRHFPISQTVLLFTTREKKKERNKNFSLTHLPKTHSHKSDNPFPPSTPSSAPAPTRPKTPDSHP